MKIGVDFGGSHIGVGLVEGKDIIGNIKEKNLNRDERTDFESNLVAITENLINELLAENNMQITDIEKIGIACPGTTSGELIIKSGNMGLYNYNIVGRLKEKFPYTEISMKNDGKCAALAEKKYGALQEYDDCIFLNVGTGIGGAAFMKGSLLEGKRYPGFEFGHMVINKGGRQCTCGKKGCFEAYCSIRAFKNKVCETIDIDNDISGQEFIERIIPSNINRIEEDIDVFVSYFKEGLCNLIDIFEPEAICFGGSFSFWEGNEIYNKIIDEVYKDNATFNGTKPKFLVANFRNNAGIIGAVI